LHGFAGWRAHLVDGVGTIGKFDTRPEAEQAVRDYIRRHGCHALELI